MRIRERRTAKQVEQALRFRLAAKASNAALVKSEFNMQVIEGVIRLKGFDQGCLG